MSGYFVKSPESELELPVDWRAGYLRREERICDDLGWSIRPVDDVENELKVVFQICDHISSRAVFSGGIPEKIYMVSSRIRTNTGRELERSFMFRIAERD